MTTLEKLSLYAMSPRAKISNPSSDLLIEAKAEIERLEKENASASFQHRAVIAKLEQETALLKSALIRIRDLCQQHVPCDPSGSVFEDQSVESLRIAQEALSE